MSSRFNTLYLGHPDTAADALENVHEAGEDLPELRIALINALRRIAKLEREISILQVRVSEP
jgi:alkanesulfonate monooxygenase SsuD/methylene tetrahydromethanopterin reductase-like flavin-dependent oxidoreductase (luciferase family)